MSDYHDELTVPTPRQRRTRFLALESWDWWWTCIFGVIALLVCLRVGIGFGTLVFVGFALLWILSMLTLPTQKNRFNDRMFMIPFWWIAEWRLIAKGGIIWKADPKPGDKETNALTKSQAKSTDDAVKRRKARATKRDAVKPFPFEAKAYVDNESREDIGLVYFQGKQTYSMGFTADGSSIKSRSRIQQYIALKNIADMLKKATLSAGLTGIGIGIGMMTRPQDPWKAPRMALRSQSVRVLAPRVLASGVPEEEYTDEDKIDVALNFVQSQVPFITAQTYKVTLSIVVTMSETRTQRQANSKNDINPREFRRLPIIKVRDMMLPMLKRTIGDSIRVMDLADVERYLRMARDAVTLNEFYGEYQERWLDEQVAIQKAKKTDEEVTLPVPVYDRYLPTKNIVVGKDFANVDGTWFSVLDMTTSPTLVASAAAGAELYNAATPWTSVAVVGKGVDSKWEYGVSNSAENTGKNILESVGYQAGGAKTDRKEQERYNRGKQIDDAGVTMDYVIRFAGLAPTRELLERQMDLETTRLESLGYGPVRINNRAQQWPKLLTTLTLIDCE